MFRGTPPPMTIIPFLGDFEQIPHMVGTSLKASTFSVFFWFFWEECSQWMNPNSESRTAGTKIGMFSSYAALKIEFLSFRCFPISHVNSLEDKLSSLYSDAILVNNSESS